MVIKFHQLQDQLHYKDGVLQTNVTKSVELKIKSV